MNSASCKRIDFSMEKEIQFQKQREFFLSRPVPLKGEVLSLTGYRLPFLQKYYQDVYGLSTVGVEVNRYLKVPKGTQKGRFFEIFMNLSSVGVLDFDSAFKPYPNAMISLCSMAIAQKFGTPNGVLKFLWSRRQFRHEDFQAWMQWLRIFWNELYKETSIQVTSVGKVKATFAIQLIGRGKKLGVPNSYLALVDAFDEQHIATLLYTSRYDRKIGNI